MEFIKNITSTFSGDIYGGTPINDLYHKYDIKKIEDVAEILQRKKRITNTITLYITVTKTNKKDDPNNLNLIEKKNEDETNIYINNYHQIKNFLSEIQQDNNDMIVITKLDFLRFYSDLNATLNIEFILKSFECTYNPVIKIEKTKDHNCDKEIPVSLDTFNNIEYSLKYAIDKKIYFENEIINDLLTTAIDETKSEEENIKTTTEKTKYIEDEEKEDVIFLTRDSFFAKSFKNERKYLNNCNTDIYAKRNIESKEGEKDDNFIVVEKNAFIEYLKYMKKKVYSLLCYVDVKNSFFLVNIDNKDKIPEGKYKVNVVYTMEYYYLEKKVPIKPEIILNN